MYRFFIKNPDNLNSYRELISIFLKADEFEITNQEEEADYVFKFEGDRNLLKRQIYEFLKKETGISPDWGTAQGVRPVKVFGERGRSFFKNELIVSDEKIALCEEVLGNQIRECGEPKKGSCGLYISIPFCPTRCLYCSFPSNQMPDKEIERYLEYLLIEMDAVANMMEDAGIFVETIYIGGGTPTSLGVESLDRLLSKIRDTEVFQKTEEITLEAGRPDTITEEKMKIASNYDVGRISINPQTMNENTLNLIGRKHSIESVYTAFESAVKAGIKIINCDLIAGLPGEEEKDFRKSLKEIIALTPDNVTIHNLAVKRGSMLIEENKDFHYQNSDIPVRMLVYASEELRQHGYLKYYMYRQKNMRGSGENVGYCKPGTACKYNSRIMDEHQSIVALGAGGVSKAYFPEENRLERIPNVTNFEIYMEKIDEMIERKRRGMFL